MIEIEHRSCLFQVWLAILIYFGTVAAANATLIKYDELGTFTTQFLNIGGITVTGSSDISITNFNGLGIVGGVSDIFVDTNEFIKFSIHNGQALNIRYNLASIGNTDGDTKQGERILEAFVRCEVVPGNRTVS